MFKKLSFYTFLMLLVPIATWAIGWHWDGDQHLIGWFDYPLYLLTESGSVPYALITCVVFMLWIMWLTRKHYSWLLVGAICAASVIGTQGIKTVAKFAFAEPRPYVVQMMGENTEQFYELSRDQRALIVEDRSKDSEHRFAVEHRLHETGYSFPSGHTIFSVSWMLVFAGLLMGARGQAVTFAKIFVVLWSIMMLISRLRLGMHYPIDLFASTLLAWVFHVILFIWIVPHLQTWKLFNLFQPRG
ncbi:phosphatidylglycerophosphatase [Pasteurellaceae bacterium 15-036681]|nr:phosphatidylglycerophosphatase [Pasteurellaceae bacterium 15-036681]